MWEALGPFVIAAAVLTIFLVAAAALVWLPLRFAGRWYRARREAYYREHPEMVSAPPDVGG